uniref:hypothetical protein n=1 Tax=Gilliamella sp. Nev6-6 TaxID=3120252 RepID=UPI0009E44737|nr:hypothetical protein [Gilliamella apicola]
MPTSRNKSEKANSTTQSAVSEGTIIIRNKDEQKQNIDSLSRDTEQASNELKHIFSKEKEQDIIDQTRLVSEIGGETNSKLNSDPKDRIQHENYKDDLRAKMEKPNVKDPELKNIMDDLYRPNAKIGSGSTADAVRYETATGQNVGGKLYLEKAKNYVKALESWLKRNPTAASADRAAAENVMKDLKNAIRGK